ncbi:MAG TPA: hypothetical protein VM639_12365 [Dongiaceae bacterium]|nr:hypothetical protein [Dongiaceae bacterium]
MSQSICRPGRDEHRARTIAARWGALASALLLLAGCVTHIAASSTQNPPPSEPLAHFDHFELLPVDGTAEAKKEAAAYSHVDGNLQSELKAVIGAWEKSGTGGRKLQIAPYVQDLKFVDGGTRFFAGALAGSSAVVVKLRLTDADSKAVIAEPQFFQRAAAMGGAWSVGATDNDMLKRIATIAATYMRDNYSKAVGGPTGYDGE